MERAIEFYESLGKLFYAIAISDKDINENEVIVLKDLIHSDWAFDSKSGQIELTFSKLVLENASGKTCFEDFVNYKKEHKKDFDPELNALIMETAGAIADSFSNKNKSELIILAKLTLELRK